MRVKKDDVFHNFVRGVRSCWRRRCRGRHRHESEQDLLELRVVSTQMTLRKPSTQSLLSAPQQFLVGFGPAREDKAEEESLFKRALGLLEIAQDREATRRRRSRKEEDDMMSVLSDAESECETDLDEEEEPAIPRILSAGDLSALVKGSGASASAAAAGGGGLGGLGGGNGACARPRSNSEASNSEASGFSSPAPRGAKDEDDFEPLIDEELEYMLANLLDRRLPSADEAIRLVKNARHYFKTECGPLMRLPKPAGRLIIVGDLHGHFSDLLHVHSSYGPPTDYNMYLFNGDFVDRGVWGPEVLFTLLCMKLLYKNTVFLNRGNHESELCTDVYGFKTHLACAYPRNHQEMHRLVHETFNELPLCYVVGGEVCVIHGGLPKFAVSLRDIARLRRGPVPFPSRGDKDLLFQALLWSDPKEKPGRSDRGLGWHFSEANTRTFLERNGLKRLVRSHECCDAGVSMTHGELVTTVFSASNYTENNDACVVIVDSQCRVVRGETWNEEYVKAEWVQEMSMQMDLDRLDLGESTDFIDFDVEIARMPGEKIGIELSMDHPLLEIPVFLVINDGCIAGFNRRNPDRRIEVGDAILEVNGWAGYDKILERLMSESHMRMRLRRPQRLAFEVKRSECPALEHLRFPEDGYAFAKQDWAMVTRFDRIVSVNGQSSGSAMYRELDEADELSLEIFRYAPADLSIKTPAEKREILLRRATSAAWDDGDSDHRAIDSLLNRIGGNVTQWTYDTKSRVLQELRSMIFMNRPQLLEAFTIKDKADSYVDLECSGYDYRGTVSQRRWAEVLQTVLGTPDGFPWIELRPYLCEVQEDSEIAYVRFLMRFHNPLSKWLIGQWCEAALDQIVHKLEQSHRAEFDALDLDRLGKVSYSGLKPFFRKHLFLQEPRTKRERRARELQYFALFSTMDQDNMGSVTRQEFVRALNKRKTMTSRVCMKGHKLKNEFLPWWQGRMDRRQCDDCSRQVRRRERRRWCDRCEFDLCVECAESREVHDRKLAAMSKTMGQRNIVHWHMVDKVLQILCASHCDIWSVFFPAGVERESAVITKAGFVTVIGDLLGGDSGGAAEFFELLKQYLTNSAQSPIPLLETVAASAVVECLRVQDVSLAHGPDAPLTPPMPMPAARGSVTA